VVALVLVHVLVGLPVLLLAGLLAGLLVLALLLLALTLLALLVLAFLRGRIAGFGIVHGLVSMFVRDDDRNGAAANNNAPSWERVAGPSVDPKPCILLEDHA
jgi:hypothetical protein